MSKYKLSTFDIDIQLNSNEYSMVNIEIGKFNNDSFITVFCDAYVEWEEYNGDDYRGMTIDSVIIEKSIVDKDGFWVNGDEVDEKTFREVNNLDDKEFKELCDTCKNFAENEVRDWIYDHEDEID